MEPQTDHSQTMAAAPGEDTAPGAPSAAARPLADTFRSFVSGVLDVPEHGQELVVTTHVWTVEELVLSRQTSQRVEVVRNTLRRVDVDVDAVGPARHE